ncbi:MAG: hypothetical protein D6712_04940 [Chloroflexi bacterium]|nr:MAG: hypothetical protein D6712_04940 [Chloroflexota bacterium]
MPNDQSVLSNINVKEYGSNYRGHFFEQYKILVESADRISKQRLQAHAFFITINSGLLALIAGLYKVGVQSLAGAVWLITLSIVGGLLCYIWRRLILSHKKLNSIKFEIINSIENYLPLRMYSLEWKRIEEAIGTSSYKPFSDVEIHIPVIYAIVYIVTVLAMLVQLNISVNLFSQFVFY